MGENGESEDDDISELVRRLNELIRKRNALIESIEYFPNVRTVKLLEKLAKLFDLLVDVPEEVWRALFKFVRCDNEGLVDLSVEQLRELVEILKAVAEIEEELAENQKEEEALEAWIEELDQTLNDWDDSWEKEQAVEAVENLKEFLKEHHPEILQLLLYYFGDDIKEGIEEWAKKSSPRILKKIVKKIIQKILEKRLGEETAKRINPWVGVALSLAELIALGYVLKRIDDLRELIDDLLAELVRQLEKKGMGWPTSDSWVWVNSPKRYDGGTVTVSPYVRCARKQDGDLTWGDPCQVTFSDGKKQKTHDLDRSAPSFEGGRWKFPFDGITVSGSDCLDGAELCYVYLKITVTFGNGKTMTINHVTGVKVF